MPTNDLADPPTEDADQRAVRAKASLMSRVEQLKQRLTDAKHKLDLPAQIAMHPLPAVGIALALGVAAGLLQTGPVAPATSGRSLRGTVFTALAAFGLHLVRDAALGQLGHAARRWATEAGGERTGEHPAEVSPAVAQ